MIANTYSDRTCTNHALGDGCDDTRSITRAMQEAHVRLAAF
ncbi:hypothetical protein [Bradyrhizobium sp. 2TAF24]